MGEPLLKSTPKETAARLLEVVQSIASRITPEGQVLGLTGLGIDLASARMLLDRLERSAYSRAGLSEGDTGAGGSR